MTTPHKAILKQALDALKTLQRYDGTLTGQQVVDVTAALQAAIDAPEPEPEPVAWIVEFENGEQELHWNDTKESLGESQMALYLGPPAVRLPCQQSA